MRESRNVSYLRLLKFLLVILVGFVVANLMQEFPPKIVFAEFHDEPIYSPLSIPLDVSFSELSMSLEPFAAPSYTNTVFSAVKTWGSSGSFVIVSRLARDDTGNLYVVGEFSGTVNFDPAHLNSNAIVTSSNHTTDAYLVKFDSNRNFQWVRTWGTGGVPGFVGSARDAANGVAVDTSGDVYVAGLYQGAISFGTGITFTSNGVYSNQLYNNIYVAKFNSNGTAQWAHTWGGTTGGEAYSIAVDKINGYVYVQGDWSTAPLTGTVDFNQNDPAHPDVHSFNGGYDAFLSKFDLAGNFQWARTWGGNGYDDGDSVAVDSSGNIYVCGMYGSTNINFDPNGSDLGKGHEHGPTTDLMRNVNVFLSKFKINGDFLWVRTWGGLNTEDAGGSVVTDGLGNVYAGGRFNCTNCNFNGDPVATPVIVSSTGNQDGFVSKYDASGTFLWTSTWGGSNNENASNLVVDASNNLYVAGMVGGVRNSIFAYIAGDAYFAKLSHNGSTQWTKTWGGTGFDNISGLVVDSAGNAYLAGNFQNTVDFDPSNSVDNHTATGTKDAYLMTFVAQWITDTLYLPFITTH
jgi:hypothetical protein